MRVVDINILLYAINEGSAYHKQALRWWEQTVGGEELVGLPWLVLLGFLRISTNPVVFDKPLEPEVAIGVVNSWLRNENIRLLSEKSEQWDILRSLLLESGTAGNLTSDAHLAALAISHGAVLVSCDNDFARFKGLRWENPLS